MAAEPPIFLRNRHKDNTAIPWLNGKFGDFSRGPARCPAPTRSSGFSPNFPPCHTRILSHQPLVLCPRSHASALVLPSCEPRSSEGRRRHGSRRSPLCRTFFTTVQAVQFSENTQDGQQLLPQQLLSENFRFPRCRFTGLLLISAHQPFRI